MNTASLLHAPAWLTPAPRTAPAPAPSLRTPAFDSWLRQLRQHPGPGSAQAFAQAVQEALPGHGLRFETAACPDQYVGPLALLQSEAALHCGDFVQRLPADHAPAQRVLLVLESPHTSEFGATPGPAQGATGELIRRHLCEVLAQADGWAPAWATTGLVLVHAVQHQCSLGCQPNRYRDTVFRHLWAGAGRDQFIERLQALTRGPHTVVINACTKGKGSGNTATLRELVEDAIIAATGRTSQLRVPHPSSWASPRNRAGRW